MVQSIIAPTEAKSTSGAINIAPFEKRFEAFFAVQGKHAPIWFSIITDTARLASNQFLVSGYHAKVFANYEEIESVEKQRAFFVNLKEYGWSVKSPWASAVCTDWTPVSWDSPTGDVFARQFSDTLTRLLSMLELENNWDSYGSVPPSRIAVGCSFQLLSELYEYFQSVDENLPTPFVAPVPDGRIQLEWESNGSEMEVCVDDYGNIEYIFFADDATKCEEGSVVTSGELGEMLLAKLFRKGTR